MLGALATGFCLAAAPAVGATDQCASALGQAKVMDGQELSYRHGPVMSKKMVWPGPERPGQVRVVFTDRKGRETRQTIDGDWAWFRLLTPGRVRRTNRADRLLVTFGTRKINAIYEITTVSLTNPFDTTQALFQFRAPKKL